MALGRHFRRRKQKQACRAFVLWSCAIVVAVVSMAGWRQVTAAREMASGIPTHVMNPDASDDVSLTTPRVDGDGVLEMPRVAAKLVPALASEAAEAMKSGAAAEAIRQFTTWLFSGEALQSEAFWLFWSVIGMGLLVVACCSIVNRFRQGEADAKSRDG